MTRDREAWNPRDRHYRRGYRQGARQRRAEHRAARSAHTGCWPLLILPVCVVLAWAGALIFAAVTR